MPPNQVGHVPHTDKRELSESTPAQLTIQRVYEHLVLGYEPVEVRAQVDLFRVEGERAAYELPRVAFTYTVHLQEPVLQRGGWF